MSLTITGKIAQIRQTETTSATFKKRDFWLTFADNPLYPQTIAMQFVQDKCSILDKYAVGQDVTVSFNLQGRTWTDPKTQETKCFNTLSAWKIEPNAAGAATPPPPPAQDFDVTAANDDDLPF